MVLCGNRLNTDECNLFNRDQNTACQPLIAINYYYEVALKSVYYKIRNSTAGKKKKKKKPRGP